MRIGLFIAYAGLNAGGPETYEVELLRALATLDRENEYHVFCFTPAAKTSIGVSQENIFYHVLWPRYRAISMLTTLPVKLLRNRTDVLHATFVPPLIAFQDYVYTLVCMSMYTHPELFPAAIRWRLQKFATYGVHNARLTICPSESIRVLALERFNIQSERLVVVHLGASKIFRPIPETDKRKFLSHRYGIEGPYFLFSGRWEPRKNISRILEAFAVFKKESRSPHKMVLTGRRTWAAEEADELIGRLGIRNEVLDVGKSPMHELPYLYSGAEALVFASLGEGFGMPIVEAMACGTPVITSNVSSMPEVAGPAALLVDPYSVADIAEAMHRISLDANLCATLRAKGLERARLFTWERTAQQTLAAYKQLAASN